MMAPIYYGLSCILLTIYGSQVCPYIDNLALMDSGSRLVGAFFLAALVRPQLLLRFVRPLPQMDQPRRQFWVDFGAYLAIGINITVFNTLYSHFPVESGLKLMVGISTFGIFFSLAMALDLERDVIVTLAKSSVPATLLRRMSSLAHRFAWIAASVVLLVAGDLALVVLKDLAWIVTLDEHDLSSARLSVMTEILFIMVLLCGLTLHLIFAYSRNLKLLFDNETCVLEQVAQGSFERYVLVATDDEFGVIAVHTNRMIDGLRERNRIKQLFGKIVSPEIARKLLEQGDAALRPAGSRRHVVILFSDIRNFTARTEQCTPEEIVHDLNRYFEAMVAIVHQHGGIVDKFIGDGMMAVFGLENPSGAADRAVQAARDMQAQVGALQSAFARPLQIGIGIHQGEVVAGTIGSSERLEYTFIGDAVNTAARLESVTKTLGSDVVISSSVRQALSDDQQHLPWKSHGRQQLKGKLDSLELFGLNAP